MLPVLCLGPRLPAAWLFAACAPGRNTSLTRAGQRRGARDPLGRDQLLPKQAPAGRVAHTGRALDAATGRGAGRGASAAGGMPGAAGSGRWLSCLHPSPPRVLAWHVVVMIAMEIIPACFVAARCCVLHCLAGKPPDWFERVALLAQTPADFFFFS